MRQMSQYWSQKRLDELEKNKLEKEKLAKKIVPSAFKNDTKTSALNVEKPVSNAVTSQPLTKDEVFQKSSSEERVNSLQNIAGKVSYQDMNSFLENTDRLSSEINLSNVSGIIDEIVFYNTSSSQKKDEQITKIQESTPFEKLIPIIIEPVKMPTVSFIRGVIGQTKQYEREWLITRSFEEFTTMIVDLFGKVDKPTKIPAAISFAYFLDLEKKPFDVKTEVPNYNDEEEHIIGYSNTNKYNPKNKPLIDFCSEQLSSFYSDSINIRKSIKKKVVPRKDELTGLDCAKWLIANNYIPEFVIVHEKNYYSNYEEEIIPLLTEWQHKNNVYSCSERMGTLVS